jgi:tol-pal system protein YbgF
MSLKSIKHVIATVMLSCITVSAFSDDAPVYDVDNYPPQFDGQPSFQGANQAMDTPDMRPAYGTREEAPQPSMTLSQRMQRAEQQINNMQHASASAKIESLQGEVQSLRSQLEELTHQVQQLQTQQRAMYTDMDSRVNQLSVNNTRNNAPFTSTKSTKSMAATQSKSSVKNAGAATTAASTAVQPNVAEEQQIYQTAYDLIKSKKYSEAISTLKKMLQKYPSGQFAANAHYWLGELYGLLNKNAESAAEFSIIVNDYPKSPKVADAQLKLGLIYLADSKLSEAKSAFKKVINRYPGSASAHLASEQLKQLKSVGH